MKSKSKTTKKPKPPVISQEVLEELYLQAMSYYNLSPWSVLSETELFAVFDPLTKQVNYCCVLGEIGEFFGITLYRGRSALEMHQKVLDGENEIADLEIFDMYDALVVEFSKKKNLEKNDLAPLKFLDPSLFTQGFYPIFRSYLPGFQGWFLSEKEAFSLILAFKCAIHHILRCQNDSFSLRTKEPDLMALYTPIQGDDGKSSWEITIHNPGPLPTKEIALASFDFLRLENLKGMKLCHDSAWEAAIFMTPSIILDHVRPYYAKICMIAHQESLLVLQMQILDLNTCFSTALAELILSSIEKNKRLPSEILVDSQDLYNALKPLTKSLGIQIAMHQDLKAITMAQEYLLEYMK